MLVSGLSGGGTCMLVLWIGWILHERLSVKGIMHRLDHLKKDMSEDEKVGEGGG